MSKSRDTARYRIGDLKASTKKYQVHICEDTATGTECLLQIASAPEHNGGLDRAAFVLGELKQASDSYEAEYAKRNPDGKLNYDQLFPRLITSFISEEQSGLRVNILDQQEGDSILKMVPLSLLRNRSQVRIDLASSAWIMGRLLKLLGFVHGQGIGVQMLTGSNVLIGPKNHRMVVFDWSSAHTYVGVVPKEKQTDDIANAARAVFAAIGGNPDDDFYPYITDENRQYVEFLTGLTQRRESRAIRAHYDFYEIVDELFGKGFREFQTLPL